MGIWVLAIWRNNLVMQWCSVCVCWFLYSISHSHNTLLCFPQETCLIMLLRSMANELIPHPIHRYLFNTFTLIIEESTTIARHQVYNVTEAYLYTRVSTQNERLKISKSPKEKKLTICLEKRWEGGELLQWRLLQVEIHLCRIREEQTPTTTPTTSLFIRKPFSITFFNILIIKTQ